MAWVLTVEGKEEPREVEAKVKARVVVNQGKSESRKVLTKIENRENFWLKQKRSLGKWRQ